MSNFKRFAQSIGATKLARFLEVTPEMVFKSNRIGYAPTNWYHKIVSISDRAITYEELYTDYYLNKLHCKPQVVKQQVAKFLKDNGKTPTSVGNKPTNEDKKTQKDVA